MGRKKIRGRKRGVKPKPGKKKRTAKKSTVSKKRSGKKKSTRKRATVAPKKRKVSGKSLGKRFRKKTAGKLLIKKPAKFKFEIKRKVRSAFRAPTQKPTLFVLNPDFEFFYELRDLVLKSSPAEKSKMVERLNKIGRIKLAVISGIFINKENLDPLISDLLVVGDDVDRRKLRAFLKATEAEAGKEIKFTVMDKDEFQYRLAMFDRFVRVLLESPHEKLINKLGI